MTRFIALISLFFALSTFAAPGEVLDTISYWKVYIGKKLIKEYDMNSTDLRIHISKGEVKVVDTLKFIYYDDTPCNRCNKSLTIKGSKGETIKIIDYRTNNKTFKIGTTELQLLTFHSKSPILRFYYKEEDSDEGLLVFEVEVR